MRVVLILMASIIGFSANATPQTFQEQEIPDLQDEYGQIWRPAPTLPGGLSWGLLMKVDYQEKLIDDVAQYVPNFLPELQKLDGERVKLSGYMIPLETTQLQSHFILMAYPHSCPFHMPGGQGGYVEVKADIPVEFSYDRISIEGQFEILSDFSDGLFYRITAASPLE